MRVGAKRPLTINRSVSQWCVQMYQVLPARMRGMKAATRFEAYIKRRDSCAVDTHNKGGVAKADGSPTTRLSSFTSQRSKQLLLLSGL